MFSFSFKKYVENRIYLDNRLFLTNKLGNLFRFNFHTRENKKKQKPRRPYRESHSEPIREVTGSLDLKLDKFKRTEK